MSHGSSMASPIPDDVKARIEAYGNAIVSDWVPQQALLGHLVSNLLGGALETSASPVLTSSLM